MAKAYSVDLRERVLTDYDGGSGPTDLARRYRVARSWIYKLLDQRRETGSIAPLPGGGGRPRALGGQSDRLRRIVDKCPDATLEELRAKLRKRVGISTLWRALRDLKITLKKSHSRRRTRAA